MGVLDSFLFYPSFNPFFPSPERSFFNVPFTNILIISILYDKEWLSKNGFEFYISSEPQKGRVYYVAYYKGKIYDILEAESLSKMEELYKNCKEFLNGLSRVEQFIIA